MTTYPALLQFYIVEDNPSDHLLFEAQIKHMGHQVMGHASTGAEALTFLAQQPVDLILMDVHLEGDQTGVQLTEKLRQQGIATPVVFVTGANDEWLIDNLLKKVRHLDPCSCIHKPLDQNRFQNEIKYCLDLARAA